MLGSCAGFLRYNFYPATIFMGDTGSQFLGFILAVISIGACQKSPTTVALVIPIIVLGLPIMETLFSFGRRASNGSSPFQADMDHIHHRLLSLGYTQRQAVYILYTICVILGIIGFIFTAASDIFAAALLLILAVLLLFGAVCFGYFPRIHIKDPAIKKKVS
jgi:UDP-GlcNAc:undecaprenyl-phosphate GlcNAc-1-phosphate transferase